MKFSARACTAALVALLVISVSLAIPPSSFSDDGSYPQVDSSGRMVVNGKLDLSRFRKVTPLAAVAPIKVQASQPAIAIPRECGEIVTACNRAGYVAGRLEKNQKPLPVCMKRILYENLPVETVVMDQSIVARCRAGLPDRRIAKQIQSAARAP